MRMKILMLACILAHSVAGISSAQPTVESVIQVGPAQWTPFLGPIHWSPNGAYVAYFNRDTLKVSDTLGNTRLISQFEWRPRRMGWITDSTIAVNLQKRFGRDSVISRLVLVNTTNGNETLLRTCARNTLTRFTPENTYFDGPFHSISGDAYISLVGSNNAKSPDGREFMLLDSSRAKNAGAARVLSLHEAGLYEVLLDESDSVRIAPNLFGLHRQAFHISRDQEYIINESLVMRLADSSIVNLESIQPGTDGCDLMFTQMHPTDPTAICMRSCSISDSEQLTQAVVYDIASWSYHFLDEFVEAGGCTVGQFSTSGSHIAVLCSDGLYILKWRP